jgi:hypothetical protein
MKTSPWNMRFLLFIVDHRSFDEMKVPLDEMFGGSFEPDDEYRAEGVLRYTNYALGIKLSFSLEKRTDQGCVYRFGGINDACAHHDTFDVIDIGFHVQKLLEGMKASKIMTLEEFKDSDAQQPS